MNEALDSDLDAYLDRELFVQPTSGLPPAPAAKKPAEQLQEVLALAAQEEQWLRTLPPPEEPRENSKDLESKDCLIPEHLKVKPPAVVVAPVPVEPPRVEVAYVPLQASLPGLTTVPVPAQPWSPPVAPAVPAAPRRGRWLAAGALVGVSVAGVLAASLLWMARYTRPEQAQVQSGHVPAVATTAERTSPGTPAHPPTAFVENSPLQRQAQPLQEGWSTAEPLPGPVAPGSVALSQVSQAPAPAMASEPKAEPMAQAVAAPEPKAGPVSEEEASSPRLSEVTGAMARATQRLGHLGPVAAGSTPEVAHGAKPPLTASVKAEPVKLRESAQAQRAPAETRPEPRRLIEDPYLEDAEDEVPFQQPRQEAPAPAPVARAEPAPAEPRPSNEYEDLDEDFAREMGFTPGSASKVPEPTGVKSVWIPPDPASQLPERLSPEQIQQVVVANQPAIVDCIKRFKDSVPGVSGGKFVLRWFVLPDGSTYGQKVETRELSGTPLGTCLERLVPSWKFPQHRVKQQEPIRFPFVF